MPIEVDSAIRVLDREAFYAMAYEVMGQVFSVHNEFSRLIEENPFKNAICRRCEQAGFNPVRREVQISVSHKRFQKTYFMDLLFGSALMVEAKTVDHLTPAHHAQAINYLLLAGMKHGLLINLRTPRVEKHFVSTNLDAAKRYQFTINDREWKPSTAEGIRMRELFEDLLSDWGVFLSVSLYREALAFLLGGAGGSIKRIPIFDGQFQLGMHDVMLIDSRTILAITALTDGKHEMRTQLSKLLSHTELSNLQWINLSHHDVELVTITS